MARKRVLVITRNFPPLSGGMERLNRHLVEELSQRYEVKLIAPRGAARHVPFGVDVIETPLRPLLLFMVLAGWHTLWRACIWRPHVILAGSGLTAPIATIVGWLCSTKSMAYLHGLDVTVPHPVYRALWRPSLRGLDQVIVNSNATARLAGEAGISGGRIMVVYPGVAIPEVIDKTASARFRARHALGNAPILLSVGRFTARKGLYEFVRDALPLLTGQYPDLQVVVVGGEPVDALYTRAQSVDGVLEAARWAGVKDNIRFLGRLSDQELADAYMAADIHIFPVRQLPNDPEGFGMVAIEAAAHGLATVAYASGGVVDAVTEGESGMLAEPDDVLRLVRAVLTLLEKPLPLEKVRAHAKRFAWPYFGSKVSIGIETVCSTKN